MSPERSMSCWQAICAWEGTCCCVGISDWLDFMNDHFRGWLLAGRGNKVATSDRSSKASPAPRSYSAALVDTNLSVAGATRGERRSSPLAASVIPRLYRWARFAMKRTPVGEKMHIPRVSGMPKQDSRFPCIQGRTRASGSHVARSARAGAFHVAYYLQSPAVDRRDPSGH